MTSFNLFSNMLGRRNRKSRRARSLRLSLRAARLLIFIANDVKLHEVRRPANKQRRPRHDSDDVPALDEFLFEQPLFGDEDEFLDVMPWGERSRHHARVEREPPPRLLNRGESDDG